MVADAAAAAAAAAAIADDDDDDNDGGENITPHRETATSVPKLCPSAEKDQRARTAEDLDYEHNYEHDYKRETAVRPAFPRFLPAFW